MSSIPLRVAFETAARAFSTATTMNDARSARKAYPDGHLREPADDGGREARYAVPLVGIWSVRTTSQTPGPSEEQLSILLDAKRMVVIRMTRLQVAGLLSESTGQVRVTKAGALPATTFLRFRVFFGPPIAAHGHAEPQLA